jgi:hypothetical protein
VNTPRPVREYQLSEEAKIEVTRSQVKKHQELLMFPQNLGSMKQGPPYSLQTEHCSAFKLLALERINVYCLKSPVLFF